MIFSDQIEYFWSRHDPSIADFSTGIVGLHNKGLKAIPTHILNIPYIEKPNLDDGKIIEIDAKLFSGPNEFIMLRPDNNNFNTLPD